MEYRRSSSISSLSGNNHSPRYSSSPNASMHFVIAPGMNGSNGGGDESVVIDHIPMPSDPDPDLQVDQHDEYTSLTDGNSIPRLLSPPTRGHSRPGSVSGMLPTRERSSGGHGGMSGGGMSGGRSPQQRTGGGVSPSMSPARIPSPLPAYNHFIVRSISAPDASYGVGYQQGGGGGGNIGSSPTNLIMSPPPILVQPYLLASSPPASSRSQRHQQHHNPRDSLLYPAPSKSSGVSSSSNICIRFFHTLFVLLCCCMTSRTYERLQLLSSSSSSSNHARHQSHYNTYTRTSAARQKLARERHRRKRQAAAASAGGSPPSESMTNGNGHTPSDAILHSSKSSRSQSDAAGSRPPLPPHPHHLSRESDDEEDEYSNGYGEDNGNGDDEDGTTDYSTPDAYESARQQASGSHCCERSCYPRYCQHSRCCCTWYLKCCTWRRGMCVLIYFVLVAVGVLVFVYWYTTFRHHQWRWPPTMDIET